MPKNSSLLHPEKDVFKTRCRISIPPPLCHHLFPHLVVSRDPRDIKRLPSAGTNRYPPHKRNLRGRIFDLSPQSFCVLEFYAHWCPACRAFAPQYELVAKYFNVAPRPEPKITAFAVDCAEEQQLCARWKINGYPAVFFGTAIEFAKRVNDVKEIKWKEKEKRTKTGAKQIVEFVGGLVIPSTEYDFSDEELDATSKKDGGGAATTKENENLAGLAFQNDQKKGLDYKTVRTMASKDDLERATVEMWNQIVYDAEIASRELNDLALSSLKSSTNSASSIEANAQGGDVTHSTLADKARGNVETIKNAIGSLIHALSKTHPIAECRASFRGLLPGADVD